ncbi:hypothetical protein IQ26_03818 [Mesorhizobium tianshanense]|uniref:Uncharacterized protein n=1 Tax=Mesorhizobium tianshanense TaxID=39844 RepID=A0A562NPQ9_9HYPH|nr:hypothetical protein IQ26_03818 [Mesorhizobium tianshanense]
MAATMWLNSSHRAIVGITAYLCGRFREVLFGVSGMNLLAALPAITRRHASRVLKGWVAGASGGRSCGEVFQVASVPMEIDAYWEYRTNCSCSRRNRGDGQLPCS